MKENEKICIRIFFYVLFSIYTVLHFNSVQSYIYCNIVKDIYYNQYSEYTGQIIELKEELDPYGEPYLIHIYKEESELAGRMYSIYGGGSYINK